MNHNSRKTFHLKMLSLTGRNLWFQNRRKICPLFRMP